MYKCEYNMLSGEWDVFYVHEEKYDYQCSYVDIQDAQDYCDIQNGALVSMQGKS